MQNIWHLDAAVEKTVNVISHLASYTPESHLKVNPIKSTDLKVKLNL